MLETYILPGFQLLKKPSHIPQADFDRGASRSRLSQDREVEEIVCIFKAIVCILRAY
jgi:hypothetical protein